MTWNKEDQSAYHKWWRQQNALRLQSRAYKDRRNEQQRERRHRGYAPPKGKENRAIQTALRRLAVQLIKESNPCADCGEFYPAFVMDFDHVRGEKGSNVSRLAAQPVAWARLLDEIEKCDLVCSNCHRYRTAFRGGWAG